MFFRNPSKTMKKKTENQLLTEVPCSARDLHASRDLRELRLNDAYIKVSICKFH